MTHADDLINQNIVQKTCNNRILIILLCILAQAGYAQTPIQASGPLIVTESNRMVTMRDGLNVSLDIYRPAQTGTYPTLYASGPYPHADTNTPPENSLTGQVAWFVSQGFNYVIANSRGTGASMGNYEFLSREEQQDQYEIIEWIADQSWSDGRVLGVGAEYYATAQWQMAIQNPPALRCIAPVNGVVRPYHDWAFKGGLSNADFLESWYEDSVRRRNAFPPNGRPRLVDYDMRLQLLAHPTYDDYWQVRSSLPNAAAINIPVFIADSWQQQRGLSGDFLMNDQLNDIHKLAVYNEPEALMLNQNFLEQDLLPFYRWCLQEENAPDFTSRPNLRYQTQGQNLWQIINTWPPQQVEHSAMYLNRQSLDNSIPASLASEILPNNLATSRIDNEQDMLTFISDPLAGDLEIAGPIMLELYVASTQTDTAFSVKLQEEVNLNRLRSRFDLPDFLRNVLTVPDEQSNDTSVINVTSGTLKASMRNADARSIDSYSPVYTFTEPSPLRPAEVTRINIALNPSAYRFRAGSRIIVTIARAQDDSLIGQEREDSIYHSDRYPSRLWLPLREGTLDTTPMPSSSLSDSPIDLQSDAIPNPFNINFDTEFNRQLNQEMPTQNLLEEIEDPIIFIRPNSEEQTDDQAD